MLWYLVVVAASGALVTAALVPLVRKLAVRVGAITEVRARDVHDHPIPRLGGLAMYLGFVASFVVATAIPQLRTLVFAPDSGMLGVLIGAGAMCALGVIDDIWELVWYAKLAGEILAAGLMAWFGAQLLTLPIFGVTVGSSRLSLVGTVVVVVLVANAVNFIDGLDGLAAGVVGIGALAFFVYTVSLMNDSVGSYAGVASLVMAGLIGICLGFLPYNFHPASIFMGDSGALMLGAVIAGGSIVVTGQIDPAKVTSVSAIPGFMPIVMPVLVLLIPLFDTTWAVVRRVSHGKSPFAADSGHLHHRLLRRGHSHTKAVLVLYLWAAVISFSGAAAVVYSLERVLPWAIGGVVLALVVSVAQFRVPRRSRGARRGGRAPGERPSSGQVIARASLMNVVVLAILGVLGGALAWKLGGRDALLSVAVAVALMVGLDLLSWLTNHLAMRWFADQQSLSMVLSFLLKIAGIFIALNLVQGRDWFNGFAFFVAFMGSVIVTLIVSSLVVMRAGGPAIGQD